MEDPIVIVREPNRAPLRLVIKEPLEIGRDCAGLLLNDPQISRLHLELRADNGHVVVTDLGSTNGTVIDGQALVGSSRLGAGSTVRFGDTTIELVVDSSSTLVIGSRPVGAATDLRRTSIDVVADAVAQSRPDLGPVEGDQGTLTIVFSDIESSTERAETLGDQQWFELLTVHNQIVRRQVSRYRGNEIKAQGDGFMLTFPSARSAIKCMAGVQADLEQHSASHPGEEIRIRVGMHTGEAISADGGDLFGKHVILAARVANEALGGEIVVSSLVREIVDSRGDITFGEARTAELKGLSGSYTMYPVLWKDQTSS